MSFRTRFARWTTEVTLRGDEVQLGGELVVDERAPDAGARVDHDDVDRTTHRADLRVQRLYPFIGSEVGAHRLDLCAELAQVLRSVFDALGLGADEQIEAVFGELAGELVADAARCSGDDGEG